VGAEAQRLRVDAVLPGTEGSLRALTGHEGLAGRIPVGTCPTDALDRATDKSTLERLAAAAGLEAPPTVRVVEGRVPDGVRYPAIAKPVSTVTADGDVLRTFDVRRVGDEAELTAAVARGGEWLVQPYLRGTLGAIGGVAWEGRLVCASHQVSPRIWPVGRGISSYAVSVEPNPALEEGVARLIELVGWSGVFGVQFLHVRGHSYVIDLNPRIYGSTALAIAAGHNLPAIWAELLLGGEPMPGPYRVGVRYRAEEDDVRAILATRQWRGLVPRRDTVHAVFDRRDPRPSLESLRKLVRR
jgi:predicted ATP-grasp superfamily ATP-dependent carboligase